MVLRESSDVLNGETLVLRNTHLPNIRSIDGLLNTANQVLEKVNCHLFYIIERLENKFMEVNFRFELRNTSELHVAQNLDGSSIQADEKNSMVLTIRWKIDVRVHRQEVIDLAFAPVLSREGGCGDGRSTRLMIIYVVVILALHVFEVIQILIESFP